MSINKKIQKVEREIENITSIIEETQKEHNTITEQLAKQSKDLKKAKIETENSIIENKLTDTRRALSEEKKHTDNDQVIGTLKKKITDLENQLAKVPTESDNPTDFQDTKSKLSKLASTIESLNEEKTTLSEQLDKLKMKEQERKAAEKISRELNEKEEETRKRKQIMQDLSNMLPNSKFSKKPDDFLIDFKKLLQNNPKNSEIEAKIKAGLSTFNSNIQIRTSLCQMTLALSELPSVRLEQTKRSAYITNISSKETRSTKDSVYVREIRNLYNKIDRMKKNTPKKNELIHKLLRNLRSDLDFFISSHQDINKDKFKELYNKFKPTFYARLHSKDVELNKHKSWKYFAINFFLGVITMGVALGIKALHSYKTTGQVTLFARNTDELNKIESMDQSLDDLGKHLLKK